MRIRPSQVRTVAGHFDLYSFQLMASSVHNHSAHKPDSVARLKSVIKISIPVLLSLLIWTGINLSFQSQQEVEFVEKK